MVVRAASHYLCDFAGFHQSRGSRIEESRVERRESRARKTGRVVFCLALDSRLLSLDLQGVCIIDRQRVLAVDVGNSRIKYGWFEPETNDTGAVWPRCVHFTPTPLAAPIPWETLSGWAELCTARVAIAGSNPVLVEETAQRFRQRCGGDPFVLHTRAALPVNVDVDFPEKVGLDRLLNAVAVNALRPVSRPAIVVDSGTATTVDWINPDGTFCGGAILPGFALSAEALHRYTALLPKLGLSDLGPDIPVALGKNTEAALRGGIFWGQVGAVRQIIAELCRIDDRPLPDTDDEHAPWLLLTGGGASWLSSQFPSAPHVPSLAMHGLVLAAWQPPASR